VVVDGWVGLVDAFLEKPSTMIWLFFQLKLRLVDGVDEVDGFFIYF